MARDVGPIIDCDIHHSWAREADLYPYMPTRWRDYLASAVPGTTLMATGHMNNLLHGGTNKKLDSFPDSGLPPGTDIDWLRTRHLDRLDISRGMLTYDIGEQANIANPYLSAVVCRAANDWCIDRWLSGQDDRLYGTVIVPSQTPDLAAAEIRRAGAHRRMIGVLLSANPVGKPFGHPFYHPIYEAAIEVGLPVVSHVGSELTSRARFGAGGLPGSRLEQFIANDQAGMHHLSSLITHAVFEKYPELRFLSTEWGFGWMPWLMWSLDGLYETLRRENPNVKRLPSEVFRQHVFATTQPLDHTDDRRSLIDLMESFGGLEDLLVFATDYPHWDGDEPGPLAARLPREWHRRIFHDNAARLFGFPLTDASVGSDVHTVGHG